MNDRMLTPILILILLLSSMPFFQVGGGQDHDTSNNHSSRARVLHDPISINSDPELASSASAEGWPGTGAINDPYIISSYRISTTVDFSIALRNIEKYVLITDCNLTNSNQAGILISGGRNVEISLNLIYAQKTDCIRILSSSYCSINNNTLENDDMITNGYNGIRLLDSTFIEIRENNLARMTNYGIALTGISEQNWIIGNVVADMNSAIIVTSDHNDIVQNEVIDSDYGIRITGDDNLIEDNWARGGNGYGIYITEGYRNDIIGNRMTRNTYGIAVVVALENRIIGNYIGKSASWGIDLYCNSGSGNIIHSNHFYYNNGTDGEFDPERSQASDLNPGNTWYDTSTDRGNFWFDWRGNDNNNDGIVDLSYPVMGGGSWDRYPIKNPSLPDAFIPPWGISAAPQSTYIDINWYAPWYGPDVKVLSYQIHRSERGGGELYLTTIPGNRSTYRDYDVDPGRAYWYYVVALNDIAYSNQSKRIKSSPDTKRPTLTIDSPKDGAYFNRSYVTILFTGQDNIAIDRYEIALDEGDPVDNGLWGNITFHDLGEGEHTAIVTVFDLAEHHTEKTVSFTIDMTPPGILLVAPTDRRILTNSRSPSITWTSEDLISGLSGFYLSLDGSAFAWIGMQMSYTFQELLPGEHDVSVRANDIAGNQKNDTIKIFVDPDVPDLDIIEPPDLFVNNTGDVLVRWYGKDTGSGIDRYHIRWGLEDWKDIGNISSYLLRNLPEGIHHLYIRVFDKAGNNVSEERSIMVDMSPPLMDLNIPKEGGRYSSEFTVEWTGSDHLSGIKEVRLLLDDGEWRNYSPDDAITIGFPVDGEHTITLEVIDGAKNKASFTRSFIFDISQPTVDSVWPLGRDISINTTIDIGFSETMDETSILIDIEDVDGEYQWEGGNLTFKPTLPLEYDTRYSLRVTGKDLAGNPLVPFDWFFFTEVNLSKNIGLVRGWIIDPDNLPVANASIRFKTGERTIADENGFFQQSMEEGDNHLIISQDGYEDTKFDFTIKGGQITELGSIPVKPVVPDSGNDEKNGNSAWPIIIVVVLVILAIAALIGWQIKKTRDYSKMPPIEDEWVNTHLNRARQIPSDPVHPPKTASPLVDPPRSASPMIITPKNEPPV